jgi:hypothetical protein
MNPVRDHVHGHGRLPHMVSSASANAAVPSVASLSVLAPGRWQVHAAHVEWFIGRPQLGRRARP